MQDEAQQDSLVDPPERNEDGVLGRCQLLLENLEQLKPLDVVLHVQCRAAQRKSQATPERPVNPQGRRQRTRVGINCPAYTAQACPFCQSLEPANGEKSQQLPPHAGG